MNKKLLLLLPFMLLTACSPTNSEPTSTPSTPVTPNVPWWEDVDTTLNESERPTVKAWIANGNEFDGTKKDSVWQKMEQSSGVNMAITGANVQNNYYTSLNPLLTSRNCDLDIVFSVPSDPNCAYETAINQDIYWNIEELLVSKPNRYPHIEKIIRSDVYKNIAYGDNIHSIIPYLTSRSGWAIYYRSDWLIDVGYYTEVEGEKVAKTPVTIEEFEEVMRLFTLNDPDKNGQNDTYALSPAGDFFFQNPLYHAFGVTPDYDLDENNEVTYMYTQEEFRDYLSWANEMFNNGYIDPQFSANAKNVQDREKFYKGDVGILITNGENHVDFILSGVEKNSGVKNAVTIGKAPVGTKNLGKEGVGGFSDWGGWWGGYSIYKHYNGSTPDYNRAYNALQLLDYLYSPTGGLTRMYGIENVHWEYDENNEIKPIIEARIDERDKTFNAVNDENGIARLTGSYRMGTAWGNRAIWNGDNFETEVTSVNIPASYKEIFEKTVEMNNVVSSKLVNFTKFAKGFSSKMNLFEKEMDRYATEVMRSNPLNINWEAELNRLNSNYSWSQIKQMIKEQATISGII